MSLIPPSANATGEYFRHFFQSWVEDTPERFRTGEKYNLEALHKQSKTATEEFVGLRKRIINFENWELPEKWIRYKYREDLVKVQHWHEATLKAEAQYQNVHRSNPCHPDRYCLKLTQSYPYGYCDQTFY